ncbi:hypothetical protein IGS68_22110 [Skermanella sp. TT6]|uniref:Uncharacterized protein n=1 Tax=Skermanella cutis TaxID=2775420 RepID=A0ABX7B318_9PROT|nr:hypothetical protein [Skermanella sp. TT6]QQP88687.1 hypothetical protein IGS68_22110 [Skermanella sp. TT6]
MRAKGPVQMQDDDNSNSPLMAHALDVIGLLKDTRLTVIESEPTDAMIAAGMAVAGTSAERTRAIFMAMLAAAGKLPTRTQ